jgi:hypothetical protein
VDPDLQEQPVPMKELSRMEIITITNPNSIKNFLTNYTLYYFVYYAEMVLLR